MKIRFRTPAASVLAAACLGLAGVAQAAPGPEAFRGLAIEVVGTGRPVLMIPGLNSGAETWRDTCEALRPGTVQCHLVQLPGFAGQPASGSGEFLPAMRDRLLAYSASKGLGRPAVVGHSLGGVIALQMAIAAPGAVGPLVIVDALPYMAAVTNPAATPETVRPVAEAMRLQMLATDEAAYAKASEAAVRNMTRDPARTALLATWGRASDRDTTAQAMYEMMVTDLRPHLSAVTSPTLVLGSWAAYKPYGSTMESTAGIFRSQFAALEGVRVEMSGDGYHFLMWDDPEWVQSQIRDFLAANPQVR